MRQRSTGSVGRIPDVFSRRVDVTGFVAHFHARQAVGKGHRFIELRVDDDLAALVNEPPAPARAHGRQPFGKVGGVLELRINDELAVGVNELYKSERRVLSLVKR